MTARHVASSASSFLPSSPRLPLTDAVLLEQEGPRSSASPATATSPE